MNRTLAYESKQQYDINKAVYGARVTEVGMSFNGKVYAMHKIVSHRRQAAYEKEKARSEGLVEVRAHRFKLSH